MTDLIKRLEALLFAVGRAISEKELSELSGHSLHDVHSALVELKKQYEERGSPLMIMEEGDSWKLTVHEKYMQTVQQINPHVELSKSILETLAVIAWKQPSTQSEVIKIRTNKAYEHIDELEKLGFVSKEKHGRTFLIKVTGKFFDYFDLPKDKGVKEIFKDIKDVEETVQAKFTEQGENIGLETYGVKEEVELEKEKKPHVGPLEIFEDVEEKPKFEEAENPVDDFLKENKKLSPQEEEMSSENEINELAEEEEKEEETPEEEKEKKEESEERKLNPELEEMISKEKKKKS